MYLAQDGCAVQHALERAIDEFFVGDSFAINVFLANAFHHGHEDLQIWIGIVLRRGGGVGDIEVGTDDRIDRENRRDHAVEKFAFHHGYWTAAAVGK